MRLLGNSKKGKWVVGGVCAFAILATASTGLAAWVIGQQGKADGTGNITVSGVQDESCAVALDETADLSVNFGPDSVGNPVVNASGASEEDLAFTIKGTLDYKAGTYNTVKVALAYGEIGSFVPAKIQVPSEFTAVDADDMSKGWEATIDVTDKAFEKEFHFRWGTDFQDGEEFLNPCKYFDGTQGKGYNEAKAALEALGDLNNKTFAFTVTPVAA